MKRHHFSIALLVLAFMPLAKAQVFKMDDEPQLQFVDKAHYVYAAMQTDDYLPLLQDKRIGIVGNQTSIVGETHLVDTLLSLGIDVRK